MLGSSDALPDAEIEELRLRVYRRAGRLRRRRLLMTRVVPAVACVLALAVTAALLFDGQ